MQTPEGHRALPVSETLFKDGGELGALMRAFDWASTPLGPPETWSTRLRTYVELMLVSKQPMYLGWTHDLIALYNDAYRPILGMDKHPGALGSRTADIFGHDAYPGLKPSFDAVLERGESVVFVDVLVPLVRHGYLEECYFDASYTPVQGDGQVEGLFATVNETTERVLGARRTRTLAGLTGKLLGVDQGSQVADALMQSAKDDPYDLPFVLLYLPTANGDLHLSASAGLDETQITRLNTPPETWTQLDQMQVIPSPALTVQPWPEPVTQTALLPLIHPDGAAPLGLLVIGLSPRKHLDDLYADFLQGLSRQVAGAFRSVRLTDTLQAQNAELEARTKMLEAFSDLTQDLSVQSDPWRLIHQTQEAVLKLLADGFSQYYEPEEDLWVIRSQVGQANTPELQALVDAGLPFKETPNLLIPWRSGEAYYQELYDPAADQLTGSEAYPGATVTLPLAVGGQPRGVLGFALFHGRQWSRADRALLATVMRSLNLALERVEQTRQLTAQRDTLDVRTQALGDANEELEAFAYSVSHDLRTPVRHIAGFNTLLRTSLKGQLDEKSARYLTVIDQAAQRMNTLIDAMLDLSRTSRQPLQLRTVDLGALVTAVRAELVPDVVERQITWKIAPLPLVMGDQDLLRQVLVNLLSNALKYARKNSQAVIEVWVEERPDEWAISVRDNGVGFDPRYADKLFGVFQRLHRQEEFEGTGVGLATCGASWHGTAARSSRRARREKARPSASRCPGKPERHGNRSSVAGVLAGARRLL